MGKQKTGGYEAITPSMDTRGQSYIDEYRLKLDQMEAKRKRDEKVKAHLSEYASDPVSQALGMAEFKRKEQEQAKEQRKFEHEQVLQEAKDAYPDDPYGQAAFVGKHYARQRQAPAAQQAFNEGERLSQIEEQDKTARKLENLPFGLSYAVPREIIGAAVETAPRMVSMLQRLMDTATGEKSADELSREAGRIGQARQQAREEDVAPELSRHFGGAMQSFIQAAATPGGGYGKAIGLGLSSANDALTTAEDAGLKGMNRLRYAGTQGLLEAGVAALSQKLFGPGVESRLAGQTVAARTWKELAKNFTKDQIKEVPEEVLTTVLQNISDVYERVAPDMTMDDFVNNVSDTVAQTLLFGAMAQGPDALKMGFQRRRNVTEPPQNPNDIARQRADEQAAAQPQEQPQPQGPAAQPQPAPVAPEIADFIKNPTSMKKYEAAVNAGMEPLRNPNRNNRSLLARRQAEKLKSPSPVPAPLEQSPPAQEAQPEAMSFPDSLSAFIEQKILEGLQNGQKQQTSNEGEATSSPVSPEGQRQEGQEGLLSPPAGTQEQATSPARTRDSFESEYLDLRNQVKQTSGPTDPAARPLIEKLAALTDENPQWADEIEQAQQAPPVVAPGEVPPDQSSPSMAGQVSSTPLRGEEEMLQPAERFVRTITPNRLKRAANAIERLKRNNPLFSDQVEAEEGTPEERLKRIDEASADRWFQQDKEDKVRFFEAMQKFEQLPPEMVEDAKAQWNTSSEVTSGFVLSNFIGNVLRGQTKVMKGVAHPEITDSDVRSKAEKLERTRSLISSMNNDKVIPEFRKNLVKRESELVADLEALGVKPNAVGYHAPLGGVQQQPQRPQQKPAKAVPQKEQGQLSLTEDIPAEPIKKPKPENRFPAPKRSLRSVVLSEGGLNAKALRNDYNQKELKENGLLGVMRISGLPVDVIAQTLETSGDLKTPEGRNPADWLIEQLVANADSARADYSSADYQAILEQEQKQYEETKALLEAEGINPKSLEGLRKDSEEAGIHRADYGEPNESELSESELDELVDTSFDFGANVKPQEPAATAADEFKLEQPKKPKPKAEFDDNENTKQSALFDAGKPGELEGQQLLFNSDPGDLNNPKTQENKPQNQAADSRAALRDQIREAMAAEIKRKEDEKEAKKAKKAAKGEKTPKAPSEKKPRESKPKSDAKQASEDRIKKAQEKKAAAAEAVRKLLQNISTPKSYLVPVDPEWIKVVANYAIAAVELEINKFRDFIIDFRDAFGKEATEKLAPAIEESWGLLPEFGFDVDAAGDVMSVLKEIDNGAASDKGVEGVAGESGGTLAPPAGDNAQDGNAERESGPDNNPVSSGADNTGEADAGGTGIEPEGTGSEPGTGTESKPGRKPSVRGSRKPVVRVPREVGSVGNLRIRPDDVIAPAGVVGKLKANIAAIKLLKKLQAENRQATEDEQRVLMQYTGWGSLQHVFDTNKGDEYVNRPGLPERYGEYYKKSLMYEIKDKYSTLDDLQRRVEVWEKAWGESYKFLKENLTEDEFKKAAASTLNAHFTSREVITEGIWGALQHMGATGGTFLEPSSGIGSFMGLMPQEIADNSKIVAIELDTLTGNMVKQLYPEADVYVKGLQDVLVPAGTVDIAATNVPFHKVGPKDAVSRYGREMNLHNYFIARMLDSLKPGGIAAVITTHFTMDANAQDREFLAEKADLVGAIRLPNSAFKANAGTEVTTDILFFRKPDGTPFKGESWKNLASVGTYQVTVQKTPKSKPKTEEHSIAVNEYFANHPEMVLGTHSMNGKQYATQDSGSEYTLEPIKDADISEQLRKAVANLPAGIASTDTSAPILPEIEVGTVGVDGRIEFRGGKLQELSGGQWKAPEWIRQQILFTAKGEERKLKEETKKQKMADAMTQAIAYTRVRNAYENHIANMRKNDLSDEDYKASQLALNKAYDAYREKHGAINDSGSSWLEPDPGFFQTTGLEFEKERIDENGQTVKTYVKADVFRERTVNADQVPTKVDTIEEAVKMSLAWRGSLNLPWMAELTGRPEEEIQQELLDSGTVFINPSTAMLEPADTYLSGNVHAKLRDAQKAVEDGDSRFEKNVEFLKQIQPAKMTIDAITPSLGANWVPTEVIDRWLRTVVGVPEAQTKYHAKGDIWSVSTGFIPRNIQNEWGTNAVYLSDLIPKAINGSPIRVMKKSARVGADGKVREVDVVDEGQTQAAQTKAEKLKESFEKWAKSDEESIPKIERAFNEQKNFYVRPKYNGEHLTFPGMSEVWLKRMRPYQKNTVWRAIREGRGMIAHGVGAGKTLELIATAMEMKRLGIANKPLLVVQNSTLGQFARTFTEVYPAAKVMVATKDDLNPQNRARFMARIATGNWDAVVMAKSTFNMKLPNNPEREQAMVEGLIEELHAVMLETELADGKGSPSVKAIQQQINSLIKRLEKIIARVNDSTDKDVYFEDMGVDALFLDEAHDYKKPPFITKLDRGIKGLATDVSGRALSALIKMRFVQDNNRGRNTFMATGTPITNTLGESWLLMNMVAPDVLREFDVDTFDKFVATFAKISTTLEQNAVGKFQRLTRLSKFKNGHQLAQFIQSGWDVLLGSDLHDKIKEYSNNDDFPTMENGKETLHMVEVSPEFERFGRFFLDVYDAYKALEGEDKKIYSWIPVVIYGAAKAAAIDVRLVDPTAADDPGSKVNKMIEGVFEAYQEGTPEKLTQLIFSDISGRMSLDNLRAFAASEGVTLDVDEDSDAEPDPNADEDRWLYNEIKRKLIAKGIPEHEVQIINDHNKSMESMLELQDKVRAGIVRIVIGHSDTLGTGVNVQTRLKDIWELDIPMVPAKREQRLGRMIRFGNINKIVRAHVMAMKKSLDRTLMAMNLRKAKAAEQALSGKAGAEFDDPFSESLMSMADMEAAMNDDPMFYRRKELEFQIRKVRLDIEAALEQRSTERERLRSREVEIKRHELEIERLRKNALKVKNIVDENPPLKVEGKEYKTLKEADEALKKKLDEESESVSKKTRENRIPMLENMYAKLDPGHYIADADWGPVQFNMFYGERKEVSADENGNPVMKWVSTSGTEIKFDGGMKIVRAQKLSTLIDHLKEYIEVDTAVRNLENVIASHKTEIEQLKAFLAQPVEGQIELDNLQNELDQLGNVMVQRDAQRPGKAKAKKEVLNDRSKAARERLRELQQRNRDHFDVFWKEWNKVTRGESAPTFFPITQEMAKAIAGIILNSLKAQTTKFEILIRDLLSSGEFDEKVLSVMKPTLINTWNAIRSQFYPDLEEATPELFDEGMSSFASEVIDEAIQAAVEESSPETPEAPAGTPETATGDREVWPELDGYYSTKNAFSERSRTELGMEPRQTPSREPREPSVMAADAYAKTAAGRRHVDSLISELAQYPRVVTPYENDLLNHRNAELSENLRASLKSQIAARDRGDSAGEAAAERDASIYRAAKRFLIEKVLETVGTLAGRALQARKAVINQEFELEQMAMEYEIAYKQRPSTEQLAEFQKKIDALKENIAKLEKLMADQDAVIAGKDESIENLEAKLKEAHEAAIAATAAPAAPEQTAADPAGESQPAAPGFLQRLAEEGKKRVESGFEKLAKMRGKAYSIETATAELMEALVEIAAGYSMQGVKKLADFLSRVEKRFGPEAKKLTPQLTQAWTQVTSGMGPIEFEKDRILGRLKPDDSDSVGRVSRDLHRLVIARDNLDASPEGRQKAVDGVHEILSVIMPELTKEQVARAMSGIGVYSEPSQDEIEVIRRDQKAQLLLLEQIADWNAGTAPPKTGPQRPPVSDEQRMLRRLVEDAKKAAGVIEATEGQLRSALDAAKRATQNRIADLTKALNENDPIRKKRKLLVPDAELEALRHQRDGLQKLYDETFGKLPLTDEQRIARVEKALDKSIEEITADLNAGRLYPTAPKAPVDSPAIEAKRAELDALRAIRDELRLLDTATQVQKAEKNLDKEIAQLEADLNSGTLYKDQKPKPKFTSEEIRNKQAKLDELKKKREKARESSGQKQQRTDAAYVRLLKKQDAELARRIAEKDFKKKEPKTRVLTPEMKDLKFSIEKQRQELAKMQAEWEFKNKSKVYQYGTTVIGGAAGFIRKILTTWDQSLIGRQGFLLGITHPVIYAKSIAKAFANPFTTGSIFPSEKALFDLAAELDADEDWVRMEKIGKLAITGIHGGINREEGNQWAPEWANLVPGVAGSERAGSAFINTQRRLVFRSLVQKLAKKINGERSISNAELRVIANFINVSTGRGSLGDRANSLQAMTHVFFSPRWWMSRLQWWVGQPAWHNSSWFGFEGASSDVRKMALSEWANQAAAQAIVMGLVFTGMSLAYGPPGEEEEWDIYPTPTNPNFGRVRIGKTVLDLTAGLGQHVSLLARLVMGKQQDGKEVDAGRTLWGYFRGKFAPAPSILIDYFHGESMGGEKFASPEYFLRMVSPLIGQEAWDAVRAEGPAMGSALALAMFFGIGARVQEPKTQARKDTMKEIRSLMNQNAAPERVRQVLNEHLVKAAATEAREKIKTANPDETEDLQRVIDGVQSPALEQAVLEEKYDIAIRALEALSTESKEKSAKNDASIQTARDLLKAMAPTFEDANKIFTDAYLQENGTLTEIVGEKGKKRRRVKPSVSAARRRLFSIYNQ